MLAFLFAACSEDEEVSIPEVVSTPDVTTLGVKTPVVWYSDFYEDDKNIDRYSFLYTDDNRMYYLSVDDSKFSMSHNPLEYGDKKSPYLINFSFTDAGCVAYFARYNSALIYKLTYDNYNRLTRVDGLGTYNNKEKTIYKWSDNGSLQTVTHYNEDGTQYCHITFNYSSRVNADGIYLPELVAGENISFVYPYLWFGGLLGRPSTYLPDSYTARYDIYTSTGTFNYYVSASHVKEVVCNERIRFDDGDVFNQVEHFLFQYKIALGGGDINTPDRG